MRKRYWHFDKVSVSLSDLWQCLVFLWFDDDLASFLAGTDFFFCTLNHEDNDLAAQEPSGGDFIIVIRSTNVNVS